MKDANKPFKHNTPLIKEDIKKTGKAEIQKTLELGPKPAEGKKFMEKEKNIIRSTKKLFINTRYISSLKTKSNFKV